MAVLRLWAILRVLTFYRLDSDLLALPLPLWLRGLLRFSPLRCLPRCAADLSRGARLRMALEALGPVFVKFGQLLSTRPDLVPDDMVSELDRLQDRVPPFNSDALVAIVEMAFGKKVSEVFFSFEREPLASASVAQVHSAVLPSGEEVVVKVIRPSIARTIEKDLALMDARKGLAMFEKTHISVRGIVENMALHTCSNCGHEEEIFGGGKLGGASKMSADFDVPLLGQLPLAMDIRVQADAGKPTVADNPNSTHAQHYRSIARQLALALAMRPRDLSHKIKVTTTSQ